MKPYPKYKSSNIQWLGDIPEHWEVKKLKYVVDLINQKSENIESNFNIALENIESGTGKIINIDADKEFEGELRPFQKNDILFSKLRPYLCKVYLAEREGTCVGELLIFRPKNFILPNYLFYNVFSKEFINAVNGSTYGTKMPRASWEDFISHQLIPIPPLPEQTVIAQFLDQKTAQIDTLIAQKQTLISLLKEERTAFINEILSDESFPLKKLKYVVDKIGSGVTPSGGANVYQLSGIPLLRSQNIYFDGLRLDDVVFISEKIHDSMKNSKVFAGDVLLNITGGSIGRCYFVDENLGEANVNQHVCIVRPSKEVITKYLYFLLSSESGQKQIDEYQTGANREGLNFEQLKNFLFPFPSLETQQKIVKSIETSTGKIDATLAKIVQEIELLKEYRVALISEVVTGKISVI